LSKALELEYLSQIANAYNATKLAAFNVMETTDNTSKGVENSSTINTPPSLSVVNPNFANELSHLISTHSPNN